MEEQDPPATALAIVCITEGACLTYNQEVLYEQHLLLDQINTDDAQPRHAAPWHYT